ASIVWCRWIRLEECSSLGSVIASCDAASAGREHSCWDPKDGELCLNRVKPEETLVEARSGSDVQIDQLAMRDEPNARLRCRNTRSSDTTKGVSSSRQQDGGHGSRNPLRSVEARDEALGVTPGRTASSADLGGSSKYSNENFED
ncbi:hypothetical protein Tco_1537371, partial [Tanacetum coccineum]